MAKDHTSTPAGGPQELPLDELNGVTGGHGVSPPPPGFEPSAGGSTATDKANWGHTGPKIDLHNSGVSK